MRTALFGVCLAIALVLAACGGGSDSKSPTSLAVPPGTATSAVASPSAGATVSVVAGLSDPPTSLKEVDPVLTKRVYALGEALPATGTGYLDPRTGSMEVWTKNVPSSGYDAPLHVNGSVLYDPTGSSSGLPHLTARSSGKTFELPKSLLPETSRQVLAGVEGKAPVTWVTPNIGMELVVIDVATGKVTRTGLSARYGSKWSGVPSPDGTKEAVLHETELSLLDIAAGSVAKVASLPAGGASYALAPLFGGGGFVLQRQNAAAPPDSVQAYDWDGKPLDGTPPAAGALPSPDGRLVAIPTQLATINAPGLLHPTLSYTTIQSNVSNAPLLRVRSAQPHAWTADRSAIVVALATDKYRVVDIRSGRVLATLEGTPAFAPEPSPTDADSIGASAGILTLSSRQMLSHTIRKDAWVTAEWTADGSAFVMSWQVPPGKDYGYSKEVFDTRIEFPPFADPAVLMVVSGADCLNLRATPSTGAASLGCYPDGTPGTITSAPDPLYDPLYDKDGKGPQPYGGVRIPEDGSVWLHLQMADGKSGWMSAAFLGWGS